MLFRSDDMVRRRVLDPWSTLRPHHRVFRREVVWRRRGSLQLGEAVRVMRVGSDHELVEDLPPTRAMHAFMAVLKLLVAVRVLLLLLLVLLLLLLLLLLLFVMVDVITDELDPHGMKEGSDSDNAVVRVVSNHGPTIRSIARK